MMIVVQRAEYVFQRDKRQIVIAFYAGRLSYGVFSSYYHT
jgi:hypothetical protein